MFGKKKGSERRRYIRISTVLPVEFYVFDEKGNKITPWLQGFTHDIGKGGIGLIVNDLWWGYWDRFNFRGAELFLRINFPLKGEILSLRAKVSWIGEAKQRDFNQYKVGLEFVGIDQAKAATLFKYAIVKKTTPYATTAIVAGLVAFSFLLFWRISSLIRENKRLVANFVAVLDKGSYLESMLKEEMHNSSFIKEKKRELEEDIAELKKEQAEWEAKYEELSKQQGKGADYALEVARLKEKVTLLGFQLESLKQQNQFLQKRQEESESMALKIQEEVKGLKKEHLQYTGKVIAKMYSWIKNRQDLKRGLVLSYEGDRNLDKVCFTYDQALASIVFSISGDKSRAQKIFDFYLEKINLGREIYNAYFTNGEVFEYTIHSGPNAWIGIAALNYIKETKNKKYLPIAQKVSKTLFAMMDAEGGIQGGPEDQWYSTEHNLDAIAFFNLYYEVTGDKKYSEAADKITQWVSRYAYTQYGPPVKRGKGDATVATDTYAWSIAALGPEELYELRMDPEAILKFAVEHCEVTVKFRRKEGQYQITGFDFSKTRNAPRGGVVSGEWTSQMILAFEILSDYFKDRDLDKSEEYLEDSLFYFNELQKMIITSSSHIGKQGPSLPYASIAFVDIGYGWRTPKGNRTGSLASTAYFLLSYYGYNPLKAQYLGTSLKSLYEEELDKLAMLTNRYFSRSQHQHDTF